MNVVTRVKKGWAAQSNSIQPQIPLRVTVGAMPPSDIETVKLVPRKYLIFGGLCHFVQALARSLRIPAATVIFATLGSPLSLTAESSVERRLIL